MSPTQITDTLGLIPDEFHEKGSLLNKRNPNGKRRKASSWFLDGKSKEVSCLEVYIEELISVIESNFSKFQKIISDCEIEIYCSFFAEEADISGSIFLNSDLIERLTIFPINLTIVMYPLDTEDL
ncbi:hypothetical protein CKA32_005132 [Geitlerinema sp. FC II]|nr:hypothetical protein CKA32_005132 [Geitlerinema sp. FC II]